MTINIMDKNTILETLVNITNANLGYIPTSPAEFNELARVIQMTTGRSISLSSIKRIWGYVKYDSFPSVTTLNTLARYNDYKDWETFMISVAGGTSDGESGFLAKTLINTNSLKVGDRLLLQWNSDKSCEIECIGLMRFRVIEAHNIKLEEGDTFNLSTVCVGHPIYLSEIERGSIHIPAYYGAQRGGILNITYIPV